MRSYRLLVLARCYCVARGAAPTAQEKIGIEVLRPVKADVSPELRSIPVKALPFGPTRQQPPARKVPPDPDVPLPTLPDQPQGAPHVLQTWDGPMAMPSPLVTFAGIGQGSPAPAAPTTCGRCLRTRPGTSTAPLRAVGQHGVRGVLEDRDGAVRPAGGATLWSGFGGGCEGYDDGDPIVQYDQLADRWLMTQFAVGNAADNLQCIAVSTSPDPTGSYYRYASASARQMNDYPKFGVWPDGYYRLLQHVHLDVPGIEGVRVQRSKMLPRATLQRPSASAPRTSAPTPASSRATWKGSHSAGRLPGLLRELV